MVFATDIGIAGDCVLHFRVQRDKDHVGISLRQFSLVFWSLHLILFLMF